MGEGTVERTIEKTRELWSAVYGHEISMEEARVIYLRTVDIIEVLAEINRAEYNLCKSE